MTTTTFSSFLRKSEKIDTAEEAFANLKEHAKEYHQPIADKKEFVELHREKEIQFKQRKLDYDNKLINGPDKPCGLIVILDDETDEESAWYFYGTAEKHNKEEEE